MDLSEVSPAMLIVIGMALLFSVAIWGAIKHNANFGWTVETIDTEHPTAFFAKTLMKAVVGPSTAPSVSSMLDIPNVTLDEVLLIIGASVTAETLKTGKSIVVVTEPRNGKKLADRIQSFFGVTATIFTPALENTLIGSTIANVFQDSPTIFVGCTSLSVQFSRHLVPQLGGTVKYEDFDDNTLGLVINAIVTNPDCQLVCPGVVSYLVPKNIRSNQVWKSSADVVLNHISTVSVGAPKRKPVIAMMRILSNLGKRPIIIGSLI